MDIWKSYRLALCFALGCAVSDARAQQADFADGLSGGPDAWEVSGLSPSARLNVRAEPSTGAAILGSVPAGAVLRNGGCRMTGPDRWCKVEGEGLSGWAAGRFLREAAVADPAAQPTPDAIAFDATGETPCAWELAQPTRPCTFRVVRPLPGEANFWIDLGQTGRRYIHFERLAPTFTDADAPISYEKRGDLFLIRIGDERYEIPQAAVDGG